MSICADKVFVIFLVFGSHESGKGLGGMDFGNFFYRYMHSNNEGNESISMGESFAPCR